MKHSKKIYKKSSNTKIKMFLVAVFVLLIVSAIVSLFFIKVDVMDNKTATVKQISAVESIFDNIASLLSLTPSDSEDIRVKYNFNYDWKFSKGQGYENSGSSTESKVESVTIADTNQTSIVDGTYDTSTWKDVSLPHTYNDTDTFDRYVETGSNTLNGERTMYTGTAWYEKNFYIPTEYSGKKIYIEFEAARQMAEIYVNGQAVEGRSENGFVAFGYDLTKYLKYGEENRIVVKVDNSYPYYIKDENGINTANSVAWSDSHWQPNYGGLYRNSYLYVVDDLHLTLPLYSFIQGQGTYVYTSNETDTSAMIHVDPEIENNYDTDKTFGIKALVKDASGNTVLTLTNDNITIAAGAKSTYKLSGILTNAKRWSTEYPYLYTIETQILVDGKVIDNNENTLGIRTFRITNDYGFYLNENYVELNGWGQKSTNELASLGSAYPDWLQSYVIKKMKDTGANLIRWGHTSGSPAQIESSDKYGLLVIQPGVDGEGDNSSAYSSYNSLSYVLRAETFRDMVIYFRNNPSVVMWELGNQDAGLGTSINVTNDMKEFVGSDTTSVANLLYQMVQKYDYANRDNGTINTGSFDTTTTDSDRLVTVRQTADNTNKLIDVAETTLGTQTSGAESLPKVESEYNRLEVRRGVWDKYTTGFTNFTNGATSEDYKDVTGEDFAVSQLKSGTQKTGKYDILKLTNFVGGVNWIFSDSISHGRLSKSEVARASGEVDGMMLEKEAYWVDKVAFSNTASSYIIGHWNYPSDTVKTIYAAAKGVKNLKLFVNDELKATALPVTSEQYLYTFPNITYEAGTISVKGYDADGKEIIEASSSKKTTGAPTSLKITPIIGEDGALANGSDVILMDVEALDADGNRCVTYDGQVNNDYTRFTINDGDGTCVWRGGYNSNVEYSTNNKYLYLEAGITRIAVRTTRTPGDITVSATTDSGLTSNIAVVKTSAVPDAELNGQTVTGLSL